MKVRVQLVRLDAPICIAVSAAAFALLMDGVVSRWEGLLFLIGILSYTAVNVVLARRETGKGVQQEFAEALPKSVPGMPASIGLVLAGLAVLVVGSKLLVDNATLLARAFGVSEAVIGLTIVAAGTSLPELATSIVAAMRREPDIAIGNVVGSNIFNVLGILGISALVQPLHSPGIAVRDLALMAGTAVLLQVMLWTRLKLQRAEGALLLLLYAGYLWMLWPRA